MTAMRRLIALAWLAGCSAGDDPLPEGQANDDAAQDREECELAMAAASCPPTWAWRYDSEPAAGDFSFVELGDIAEPVCDGRGLYAEALLGAGTIGVTIVRNSQCSIVCYPECTLASMCWAERPDGQPCGTACEGPGPTAEECGEFVAECLREASVCDG